MTRRIVIEELARVEGHGGIQVDMEGDAVASVHFDVFEGARLLETLLNGRHYLDVAPTISRICAICSTAHLVTSLKTTEAAFGVQVSEQTEVLRELLFRGENIESHALHVFLLAAPDYLGYPSAPAMAREFPEIVKLGLELKQLGNRVQEVIGGRAIHPTTPVLGGFAQLPDSAQLVELRDRFAQALERVPQLLAFVGQLPPVHGCFAETVFAALAPDQYGYSRTADVTFKDQGHTQSFEPSDYRGFTNEMLVAHSNAKHSLFEGAPFMVGAL
ncbi:MAG TPA: nickel-dependent hydrogenase large subunit, partial [Longimicrobiales bacterium]|nr:nickel-dependent hydrogenase large subunit [Longimicrobiales bacterium]